MKNNGLILLLLSAAFETVWNICLKQSKGLTDWLVNIIGVSCLLLVIFFFKRALNYMPLGVAAAVWSGVSLTCTILVDVMLFKTTLNYKAIFFLVLCMISIIGLNYFSAEE